ASALLLTLSNPMTILSFLAVFASLSGHAQPGMAEALLMVAGVFAGSALWWCVLAFGAGRLLGPAGRGRAAAHRYRLWPAAAGHGPAAAVACAGRTGGIVVPCLMAKVDL
ncbi:LysE family transporter, partial [Aquitalea magnusonii]|uniref:LysE family transporter n=1 Tax=Aquitalea magnusonii TaxID=332411 RepID=UPI00137AB025